MLIGLYDELRFNAVYCGSYDNLSENYPGINAMFQIEEAGTLLILGESSYNDPLSYISHCD